jgi:hypothetical protein
MSLGTFAELNPVANHRSRVYAYWVNGHEELFYRGETAAINEILAAFAAAPLDQHIVVIRPGPQSTKDFDGNSIAFDAKLDVIGGIATHQSTLDRGEHFWPRLPVLTVCIDEQRVKLAELEIPGQVTPQQLDELRTRYVDGLISGDHTVRGWGTGHLSRLHPYSEDDARVVARMLRDPKDWVRLNAAGAISRYGATAKPLLPALRELLSRESVDRVQERLTESIDKIAAAEADPGQISRHASLLNAIDEFCQQHKPSTNN